MIAGDSTAEYVFVEYGFKISRLPVCLYMLYNKLNTLVSFYMSAHLRAICWSTQIEFLLA